MNNSKVRRLHELHISGQVQCPFYVNTIVILGLVLPELCHWTKDRDGRRLPCFRLRFQ